MSFKLAVIGASGLVGNKVLELCGERDSPFSEIITAASTKSTGTIIEIKDKRYILTTIEKVLEQKPTIAIFSAGRKISQEWAPKFVEKGCYVIDNSSQWRMDPNIKLVVPEVNIDILTKNDKIIANPNCSTIQLVIVLNALSQRYKIRRVIVSTYQSVSGIGKEGVRQLLQERSTFSEKSHLQKIESNGNHRARMDLNAIPHIDEFLDNGYTKEEMKIINETKKILNNSDIKITATAVRIPVINAHSESVNIEIDGEYNINEIKQLLKNSTGIKLEDDPDNNIYPMPSDVYECDLVRVGRIRRDLDYPEAFNIWIVANNIRKGAATNALQIADYVYSKILNVSSCGNSDSIPKYTIKL